jgi:hypothetical protein
MVRLEDGAQESEIGDAEQDLLELMGQMMPRIRRLLAQQHRLRAAMDRIRI